MKIHCFTSISLNYLPKARVLGQTLKRFHPEWKLTVCITDRCPAGFIFNIEDEPFDDVVWSEDLIGPDSLRWIFQHDVVEVCTAVKGPMLRLMTEGPEDCIIYLDPDTAVFNSLAPLVDMLERKSIILTPHQLLPETTDAAVVDNEICSLAHGTYNLGFIAIRNDTNGKKLAKWWEERLLRYCIDEKSMGLFVDQKWCDLIPALFDGVEILRDPGYNVASWNLSNRIVRFDGTGGVTVNGAPLRFFHFTKLGPIGDVMTQKYAGANTDVYELWSWYKRQVTACLEERLPGSWWHYGSFSNGVKIPKGVRRLFRNRLDLQRAFPNPFDAAPGGFYSWLRANEEI